MKYTVVIRQPVPDDLRPELEELLRSRFGLNAEQAGRLASRRSGRLMKPTGRPRAELLLGVFQQVGAQVALEEVREETGLLTEPFQGVVPAGTRSVRDTHDDAVLAPDRPEAARFAAPTPEWPGDAPAPGGLGLGLNVPPPTVTDPFDAPLAPAPVVGAPAPTVPVPMGAGATPAAAPTPAVSAPPLGRPAAPPEPDASDVWSDFTGALTITDSTPAEDKRTVAGVVPMGVGVPAPAAEALAATQPRIPLQRRMSLGALVPLALSSALTLGLLSLTLPALQRQLVQQNAQAVAVAVGTSLDTRDQESVNAQLGTLLSRTNVGFVRVELPDGTTYFRSKDRDLESLLQPRVATFLTNNPQTGEFRFAGSAADAYSERLEQLEDVGAGESEQAEDLRKAIVDPENTRQNRVSYVVQRLAVAEGEDGQRTTTAATSDDPDVLYRIAVGVPNTEAAANLRNTLLLVLGISLLALGIAAALAVRAARRIVEPIERLVKVADAISMGDLSRPVTSDRNDEIGDLAQALERMRLSLEAAMDRLRRRKRG